jgi:hypothetical protein
MAGDARIPRVNQHAITGRHRCSTETVGVEEDRNRPVLPRSRRDGETPVEDQLSLSRRDRSRRFKIAVAGQYRPVSEAIHGYDKRVDVESICRITKSIALFVAEWCGVAEAR